MKMEEVVDDVEVERITPPRKKLKQARLPFQVLSPDVGLDSISSVNKRKLSEGDEGLKAAKIIKNDAPQLATETKENICVDSSETTTPKNAFKGFSVEDVTKATSMNLTLNANIDDIDIVILSESDDDPEPEGILCTTSSSEKGNITESKLKDKPTQLNTSTPSVESSLDKDKDSVEIILSTNDSSVSNTLGEKKHEVGKEIATKVEDNVEMDENIIKQNSSGIKHPSPKGNSIPSVSEILDGQEENKERMDILTNGEDSMKVDAIDIQHKCAEHLTPQGTSIIPVQTLSQESATSTQCKRKLTPKQLLKKIESSKKKEEREKMKEEKERIKQEKEELRKKEREKQRLEKEEQKKKEREKQKQEKEDVKKKEKEEKERKRQAELDLKNEEKKAREEERRKKELVEEEAKRKKQDKAAAAFTSFFLNKKIEAKGICELEPKSIENQNFMPFEVKGDMRLAPLVRNRLANKKSMDVEVGNQTATSLYLSELKKSCTKIKTSGRTWPLSELKDEVILLDDVDKMSDSDSDNMIEESKSDGTRKLRAKLFLFHENRRPPYWGTWRKKSACIHPTRPFAKDEKLFDYEVDSDDEWEEEEPGESLHGSDDEKESVDDYEIDNDFFVPHGYLSDEENEGQEEMLSPETHKAKLKVLELEFEEEMKHKTERIKPRLLGCIWASNHDDIAGTQLMKLLESRRVVYCNGPIEVSTANSICNPSSPSLLEESSTISPLLNGVKKMKLPDESIPDLIRLTHGNTNSRAFLVKEFAAYWKNRAEKQCVSVAEGEVIPQSPSVALTKSSIADKIKEVAQWMTCAESPMNGRKCWYVSQDVRSSYGLMDLTTPNKTWIYTMQPRRVRETLDADTSPFSRTPKIPLITNFTKTMTAEERHKLMQLTVVGKVPADCLLETSPKTSKSCLITNFTKVVNPEDRYKQPLQTGKDMQGKVRNPAVQPSVPKKRVSILISVPRGQDIPKSTSSLMDHFKLQPNNNSTKIIKSVPPSVTEGSFERAEKPIAKDKALQVDCIDTIQID